MPQAPSAHWIQRVHRRFAGSSVGHNARGVIVGVGPIGRVDCTSRRYDHVVMSRHAELLELPQGDPRWSAAFPVLRELRTHLTTELLDQVLQEATAQGLRFTGLFLGEECVAIAGWRVIANTSAIRKLYIDDLCTAAAARSRGYGGQLLSLLTERAAALGCYTIELDSGVQRHDAHRFYLRERMDIVSHHFSRRVSDAPCD